MGKNTTNLFLVRVSQVSLASFVTAGDGKLGTSTVSTGMSGFGNVGDLSFTSQLCTRIKMDGCKISFLLGRSLFRGYVKLWGGYIQIHC